MCGFSHVMPYVFPLNEPLNRGFVAAIPTGKEKDWLSLRARASLRRALPGPGLHILLRITIGCRARRMRERAPVTFACARASGRRTGRTDNGCRADPATLPDDIAPRTPGGRRERCRSSSRRTATR